ncbi:MAG: NUDIX hydrolase, partial [Nitrosarchaeum sp.]|nr:NUDIX hydrolase [Nitrosarchaeum sp.]
MKKKKIFQGKILNLTIYDLMIKGRKVKREMIE